VNTETKYQFDRAYKVAAYIETLLKPFCVRLHIAGSIRRLRPEIGDIEIVCEPRKVQEVSDLFGGGPIVIDKGFTEALMMITEDVLKGDINGRMMQIRTNSRLCPGIKLDLFMPAQDDYYRILAIRTGSAEYAQHVIAASWKKKGWTGVKELGLRLIKECISTTDNGGKVHYKPNPEVSKMTLPPVWRSEGEFFTWLGLEYIDPELREHGKPLNEAQ
jgi:DNA polymerase/3'-5' exonuclease PolX